MLLIFLELPLFLLTAGKGKSHLLFCAAIFAVLIISGMIIQRKKGVVLSSRFQFPLTSCLLSLTFAMLFYFRWHTSGRMKTLAELIRMPINQTCIITALFLAFFSLTGIDSLLKIYYSLFDDNPIKDHKHPTEKFVIFFTALTACAVMFLNSRCSPFFPFNDWGDPNTMFTVGKGVLKGYVPYRDLYEQKGPLLVFLHTFGASVSYYAFTGIWILEIIACFVYLYLTYKILCLFFEKNAFILIPFLAAATFSPYAFRTGDTAEEFALPLLTYALYVLSKAIKEKQIPSQKEFFFIGITSGAVFWLKYSMTGLYLGWFLTILCCVPKEEITDFIEACLMTLCGVIIITFPIFIYFAVNNALDSLFHSYFYNNLVFYANDFTFMDKMRIGIDSCKLYMGGASLFIILGGVWMLCRRLYRHFFGWILTITGAFIFIFIGGARGPYYCLPLAAFSVYGFSALYGVLSAFPRLKQSLLMNYQAIGSHCLFAGLMLLCIFSHNLRFLEIEKEDMFQYQMKTIIDDSGIRNPSILSYQIGDAGVNTVTGAIPNLRYFCYYNNEKMTEMKEEQERCIKNRCVNYIIARTKFDNVYPHFDTYDHQGAIIGMADRTLEYFHYYTPKTLN